jgi:hypothetical protein
MRHGMTNERYWVLTQNAAMPCLTDEEVMAGWHFCHFGWDGMLIHLTDDEMAWCGCTFHTECLESRADVARKEAQDRLNAKYDALPPDYGPDTPHTAV